MGPPKLSYERIAPPNSFIHVQDFKTPKDLAMSVTIASFFKTLSSIHNGNHFQVPVTLGLSSRGISEIPWSVKIIAINQFQLNSVQLGKVATRPNVLNLGAVNCAGRCRRCKDQRGDRFRASSMCGRTAAATQTGLTRRGASNDGPAGRACHIGATQSLRAGSRIDEEYSQRYSRRVLVHSPHLVFPFLSSW